MAEQSKPKTKTDEIKEKQKILKAVRSDPELSYYEEIIREDERKQFEQKEQEYKQKIDELKKIIDNKDNEAYETIYKLTESWKEIESENNQLKKEIERLKEYYATYKQQDELGESIISDLKNRIEQLKSQLQEQRKKIEDRIEHWNNKITKGISHNDIDLKKWKFVVEELKSLLGDKNG